MKSRKPILMTFDGGPIHGLQANMTWIPQVEVVTDDRETPVTVFAYVRDEMVYRYDHDMSLKLTATYPHLNHLFRKNPVDVVGTIDAEE